MKILIIEDEEPASERIISMIREIDPGIRLLAVLRSVKESVAWLSMHAAPDLIIVDIQLNDGLSLEIFKQSPVPSPLIFTTAFDDYLLKAFEYNSIDYLLKPIDKEKLRRALEKYSSLRHHFSGNFVSLFEQIEHRTALKDRLVVKKGGDFVTLRTDQIAYFYSEHKISFLVDREGKRFIMDKPLSEIESGLDPKTFFRLNRQFLVHIDAVAKFRSSDKGKWIVALHPATAEEVTVSQENAAAFKEWIGK